MVGQHRKCRQVYSAPNGFRYLGNHTCYTIQRRLWYRCRLGAEGTKYGCPSGNFRQHWKHRTVRCDLCGLSQLVVCCPYHYQHFCGKLRFFGKDDCSLCHQRRQRDGQDCRSAKSSLPQCQLGKRQNAESCLRQGAERLALSIWKYEKSWKEQMK